MNSRLTTLLRTHPMEESTWKTLYDLYLPQVFHYMCYKVGNVQIAEDLTATTFEKAWKSKHRFRKSKGAVQSWIFGIARHVVADHFRKPCREESLDCLTKTGSRSPSVEKEIQNSEEFEAIFRIIQSFPKRDKELISLKYGAELTNRKIASMTGLSETNVGTILHRSIVRIRIELRGKNE